MTHTVRWSAIGSPTRPCHIKFRDGILNVMQDDIDSYLQIKAQGCNDPWVDLQEYRPVGGGVFFQVLVFDAG